MEREIPPISRPTSIPSLLIHPRHLPPSKPARSPGPQVSSAPSEEIPTEELPWGQNGQDSPEETKDQEAPVLDSDGEVEDAQGRSEDISSAVDEDDDVPVDDDGCISIDVDDGASLSDLVEQAAQGVAGDDGDQPDVPEAAVPEIEVPDPETSFADVETPTVEPAAEETAAVAEAEGEEPAEHSVDLLAEILADR